MKINANGQFKFPTLFNRSQRFRIALTLGEYATDGLVNISSLNSLNNLTLTIPNSVKVYMGSKVFKRH